MSGLSDRRSVDNRRRKSEWRLRAEAKQVSQSDLKERDSAYTRVNFKETRKRRMFVREEVKRSTRGAAIEVWLVTCSGETIDSLLALFLDIGNCIDIEEGVGHEGRDLCTESGRNSLGLLFPIGKEPLLRDPIRMTLPKERKGQPRMTGGRKQIKKEKKDELDILVNNRDPNQ
ncbi:hypothetical protein T310_6174 [Rasamsonia emersonii CBS 393.64]|uniref:Uncharacterized protein n=1 Tax=Rasamsonia emersonii (strain ATCC 16479 / CBS 393.64 / IMI 116815) TaxID=1408163 RepID=A0A0F4YP34_RASE3|nr:hypothetical protein T310_6174 [Rasamsonia emersonii CBS 393.64]KKA19850.1 hypothetical protein T310_6174 [Rasamsonia emersonii CBS 393.64]